MTQRPDPLREKCIQRLHDPAPVVRRNAAAALRRHRPRAIAADAELHNALDDEDAPVRADVQHVLQRICQVAA